MRISILKISISLNGCNSNLTILEQPWTFENILAQSIVLRDFAGNAIITLKVLAVDERGNCHVKCGDREFLIYVEGDCLYIREKNSIPSFK